MNGRSDYFVQKRIGFLPALAIGFSGIVMTALICGAGVVCYGLKVADGKLEDVFGIGRAALKGLPEFRRALPPVFADAIQDERRPEYVSHLQVKARLVEASDEEGDCYRPVLEIRNDGESVVSLLAVRTVLRDAKGAPRGEWGSYAATPIAGVDTCDWRGPLMPGSVRVVTLRPVPARGDYSVSCEIADVRIWRRDAQAGQPASAAGPRADRTRLARSNETGAD